MSSRKRPVGTRERTLSPKMQSVSMALNTSYFSPSILSPSMLKRRPSLASPGSKRSSHAATSSGSSIPDTRSVFSFASRFSDGENPLWFTGIRNSRRGSGHPVLSSENGVEEGPREIRSKFGWSLLQNGAPSEKRNQESRRSHSKQSIDALSGQVPDGRSKKIQPRTLQRSSKGDQIVDDIMLGVGTAGQVPFICAPSPGSRSSVCNGEGRGLYRRSKKFIKGLRWSSGSRPEPELSDPESDRSRTQDLLEKTSGLLQVFARRQGRNSSQSSSTPTPSPSPESASSRKLHHLILGNGTMMSKSSSILNMLMGKPPASTPTEEALYRGNNQNEYFKVEISDPDGPTFLPSEATRVGTPPLPTDRPRKGDLRGFSFDYSSPGGSPYMGPPESGQKELHACRRTATMESEELLPFHLGAEAQKDCQFELNVPEHLPGSPLCPRSPLHPSGGKGICVYHGRTRTMPLPVD